MSDPNPSCPVPPMILGPLAAQSDLIGRRVQVTFGGRAGSGADVEGPVHAVATANGQLAMWVCQEREGDSTYPRGEIMEVVPGRAGVLLLPLETVPQPGLYGGIFAAPDLAPAPMSEERLALVRALMERLAAAIAHAEAAERELVRCNNGGVVPSAAMKHCRRALEAAEKAFGWP